MNTMPRFCTNCGRPLNAGSRFCGQCGQTVQPLPAAPPAATQSVPPPAPVQLVPQVPMANVEPVLGVVPGMQRRKGLLGVGTQNLTLVVTPVRLVFVPLSTKEMNQAILTAREQAKAQGKGFLGQWGAQLGWLAVIRQQYQAMPVQTIISQHPGGFFISNAQVSRVHFRQASIDRDSGQQHPAEMRIDAAQKHRFVLKGVNAGDVRHLLQQTLGAVVR